MTKDEALDLALAKIKSAQICHPRAVLALLMEAEETLEQARSTQTVDEKSCGNCKHFNKTICIGCRDGIHNKWEPTPVQEPHSWYSAEHDEWMINKTRKEHERLNSYTHKVGGFDLPLYTSPPAVKEKNT